MIANIRDSSFMDLSVSYGGICAIISQKDLFVENVFVSNIEATSYYRERGTNMGCPCILYIGRNFYATRICCREATTAYDCIVCSYTTQNDNNELNYSSFTKTKSYTTALNWMLGHCKSKDLNYSDSQSSSERHIHFGCAPISYYQINVICTRCTAQYVFGHSNEASDEQICKNIVLISNTGTDSLIYYTPNRHRLINAYIKDNQNSSLKLFPNTYVVVENCSYDILDGNYETEGEATFYELRINLDFKCAFVDYKKKYELANNARRCYNLPFFVISQCFILLS